MADLTTTAAVKRQLEIGAGISPNNYDDDLIALYVTQASQLIETECARPFSATTGTLFYDARYPVVEGRTLYFDQDVLGVDAISNGSNGTMNAADYRLLPVNGSPKYALQLLDKSGLDWQTGNDGYAQNAICMVGTTGYCLTAAQPADITLAATKLAAFLYQHRNDTGDSLQMADGSMVIPAQVPTFVIRTISRYVRRVAYSELSHS